MIKKIVSGVSAAVLLCGMSVSASAGVITWQTLGTPQGATSAEIDGFATVSVVDNKSNLTSKSRTDSTGTFFEGFGTETNPGGEISAGQSILITFVNAITINRFSVAFLFPPGSAGDTVEETAIVSYTTAAGDDGFGTLKALSELVAEWTFDGATRNAANLSPANHSGNAAAWEVTNPFGSLAITSLTFTAEKLAAGGPKDSDFAILEVAVPEPGMLALLALGLFGLGFSGRRVAAKRK